MNIFPLKVYTTTFAMPLFMSISGFLLYAEMSSGKMLKDLLIRKIKRILVPCLIWEVLLSIFTVLLGGGLSFGVIWFFWSYFFCSVIFIFISKGCVAFKKWKLYLLCFIVEVILMLLPFDNLYLPWMFSSLAVGYFVGAKRIKIRELSLLPKTVLTVVFIVLCVFWKQDYTVYNYGSSLLLHKSILIHLYRILIGVIGSAFAVIIFDLTYRIGEYHLINRVIEKTGIESFGIYVIHAYFLVAFLRKACSLLGFSSVFSDCIWVINYMIAPIAAIGLILISHLIIAIIKKSCLLNKLLLGAK